VVNDSVFCVQSHGEPVYTCAEIPPRTVGRAGIERTPEDDYADLLVRMWSLVTGRVPRLDVHPGQFTEQELLWFWDDTGVPAGRHARTAGASAGGDA
jgi:hypothetical protein